MSTTNKKVFVFDVESIGLHGEGFAVAGGFYDIGLEGVKAIEEFSFSCPIDNCSGLPKNIEWCKSNVTLPKNNVECKSPLEVRKKFWEVYERYRKDNNIIIAAETPWPVEAKFLEDCINDDPLEREWSGPYPLIDITSVMFAVGMEHMKMFNRNKNELPEHNPLADSRLSARLLKVALFS